MKNKQYDIIKHVGKGTFGYVFLAQDQNGKLYGIKRTQRASNQLSREIEILNELKDCPQCIHLLEVFYSEENDKMIQNMVFEYYPNDLFRYLNNHYKNGQSISVDRVKQIMKQIFQGLLFIHQKGIAHRDLKLENILLTEQGQVKICDFGSAKFIDKLKRNSPYVVSQYYRAPELFLSVT